MKYEGRCGSCRKFRNTNNYYDNDSYDEYYQSQHSEEVTEENRGKGYCTRNNYWCYPTDGNCYYYDGPEKREESSSWSLCYITTLVCNRLGLDDNCDVLNTLRLLRGNVLQKDEKYKGILYEYDTVGPKIAEKLSDEDMDVISKIYDTQLKPIVGLIKLRQYDNAIKRYVDMTKGLEDFYGITYDGVVEEDYDYSKGGHGYIKSYKKA